MFAVSAAEKIKERIKDTSQPYELPAWDDRSATDADELVVIKQVWEEIRRFMWNYVGIVRTNRRLERARTRLALVREEIREHYWDFKLTGDLIELRNLALVAELVVESALRRRESRGLHFTSNYPESDPRFIRETLLKRYL